MENELIDEYVVRELSVTDLFLQISIVYSKPVFHISNSACLWCVVMSAVFVLENVHVLNV